MKLVKVLAVLVWSVVILLLGAVAGLWIKEHAGRQASASQPRTTQPRTRQSTMNDPTTNHPWEDTPILHVHHVEYRVSSARSANSITYTNETGDTAQDNGQHLPWTYDLGYDVPEGSWLYLSAQNNGGGTITCEIVVDGVVVKNTESHGLYSICEASGGL
jgi:Mycobacterium membrane protein